jgi:hypothetical protein
MRNSLTLFLISSLTLARSARSPETRGRSHEGHGRMIAWCDCAKAVSRPVYETNGNICGAHPVLWANQKLFAAIGLTSKNSEQISRSSWKRCRMERRSSESLSITDPV